MKVCESIPYSEFCLADEVGQLKAIYRQSMQQASSEEAKRFFEEEGLDPWAYGYNPTEEHVQLNWGGYKNACEEPVTP